MPKDDTHWNENAYLQNYSVSHEFDENDDYDSDCSTSSVNSLLMRLKKNMKSPNFDSTNIVTEKQTENADLSKAVRKKNSPLKNIYHSMDDQNLLKRLKKTPTDFYGKQVKKKKKT